MKVLAICLNSDEEVQSMNNKQKKEDTRIKKPKKNPIICQKSEHFYCNQQPQKSITDDKKLTFEK